ncbi:hypothetical protein M878_27055 [Streptomyces roseochromogenus subsp. oscitans DS 12.976]|uniref:LysM domain-containing protein n=1 Tax=Streptomyces roseochromogenus subsp. oscitans DS 12.976 TaxID=1352936 RepID=V6KBZ3_STRRC|nr:hypothetical protein M878_27055 [Streptomyces roseochromogenus subsp. oscitans DS 12.976]
MTGSAIAIPLLGAASANAADGTTWDKIAECESGGSWSANSGNGYYGGLQISQDDWDKYGGTQYADSADQASRSQQIAVAEKILAGQGTKPWAMCALTAGLTSHSGSVDVDPGVSGSGGSSAGSGSSGGSDPSGLPDSSSSGSSSGSGSGSDSGSGSSSDASPGADSGSGSNSASGSDSTGPDSPGPDASGSSSSGATATPAPGASPGKGATGTPEATDGSTGASTPKSDKGDETGSTGDESRQGGDSSPTATPGTDESDNSQQTSGSWSLVDTGTLSSGGRHRGESADESAGASAANGQNAPRSGRHADRERDTYTVREGDSLTSIADSLGVDGGWHALYAANQKVIGADPNHITAGQTLKVTGEKDAE